MTATLQFNLPEEHAEFETAVAGARWRSVSWDMDQWLRGKLKYGQEYQNPGDAIEACRIALHEHLSQQNLTLD